MTGTESFICPTCGEEHEGLPTDRGFKQPDVVFSLSYLDEYARARINSDLCTLDESRFFLRGVLHLPFSEKSGSFGWGLWTEVSKETHDLYVQYFDEDGSEVPRQEGEIANHIPIYDPSLLGQIVEIQFGNPKDRPFIYLAAGCDHPIAADLRQGVSNARQHEFVGRPLSTGDA